MAYLSAASAGNGCFCRPSYANRRRPMLTNCVPDTWQNLQEEVARVLAECGFVVQIERSVSLARGQADIDVYAEEVVNGRRYVILCECKFWKAAIPQTVIHSFRTVTADAGANVGYVISANGFQAGALTAVEQTNIRLVTWDEFLGEFEPTWISAFFVPTITDELDPLMTYVEPLLPAWWNKLTPDDQAAYMGAHERYSPLGLLAMSMSRWARILDDRELPVLPLRRTREGGGIDRLPDDVLDASGYRELLGAMLQHGRIAIAEFRLLRDKVVAPNEREKTE